MGQHRAKNFACIISSNSRINPWGRYYHHHFTDGDTDAREVKSLLQGQLLSSGWTRTKSQFCLTLGPWSPNHYSTLPPGNLTIQSSHHQPLWPSLFGQDLIWLFSFYSYRWESQALLVWGWPCQVWESEPPWTWASPRLLLKWCRKYISHCFSGLAGTSEGIQGNTSLSPRGFLDPDKRSSGFYLHTFCKRELTIYQGIFSTSVGSDCWKSFAYTEICLTVTIYH